jgi:hypothetical protein
MGKWTTAGSLARSAMVMNYHVDSADDLDKSTCAWIRRFQINKSNQLPLCNGNETKNQTIKSHQEAHHPETNYRNVRSRKVDGASNN